MNQRGVHLRPVDKDNVRAACALELAPGQETFVAPVAVSLAQAYTEPDLAWPRLVYDGDDLVAFVMAEFDDAEGSYWLWRLNVAAAHQRRGYGAFAVNEVAREAQCRGATELFTSYVPDERGPGEFYRRLGFEPTGEVDDGEIVVRLNLPVTPTPTGGRPAP